jgi:hypothetical protein
MEFIAYIARNRLGGCSKDVYSDNVALGDTLAHAADVNFCKVAWVTAGWLVSRTGAPMRR